MNTTDDGAPVGEAPELSGPTGMFVAADRICEKAKRRAEALTTATKLIEIAQLHRKILDPQGYDACDHCWDPAGDCPVPWPCETMRIIERVTL